MKKTLFLIMIALAAVATAQTDKVNVFIGTNGMGHTFPGACYPYGSVQLSPDTDTIPHNINGVYQPRVYDYCAGYQYKDSSIVGFSHTHFSGTGHSDLGDILIMPYSGETKLNPGTRENPDGGYRQRYSKSSEEAHPGYYKVLLSDDSILCELTATPHCGIHRYTFPKGAPQKIILDLNHGIYNYDGKTLWAQCNVVSVRTDLMEETVVNGYRVTNGWSRTNRTYFAIRFNKKIKRYGCKDFGKQDYRGGWAKFDTEHDFPEMGGRKLVTWFEFEDDGDDALEISVGLSSTSMDAAFRNLVHDMCLGFPFSDAPTYFDQLRYSTEYAWQKRLSTIECQGSADQQAMLYTSLYHTLINPSLYQDASGKYRGIDQEVHESALGRTNYTVFSLWDTYRALHPLLTLIDTTLVIDIAQSFHNHFSQSPHHMLPVWSHMGSENWCMIGYHGVSVLMDAMQKGILDSLMWYWNGKEAPMAIESSNCDYYGNTGLYKHLGYVPVDKNRSGTSITLENAYEDWTIYMGMKHLGEKEYQHTKEVYKHYFDTEEAEKLSVEESGGYRKVAEEYRQRALSYRNVFDTTIGFARARYSDGSWKKDYSLLSTSELGLVEGNAWNYSFYVPHDVNGLMRLMGGEKKFVEKLDTLFTMFIPDEFFAETEDVTREGMLGGYVQGNEPSHHIPYLYMWTSQPWKTQYWVREIMNKMYRNHIDGLCGNDDCGQMSAWYIFSVMGFYPVCPGSGEYVIGAPYMPYMKVRLANGKTLEIKAPKVSDKNLYIQQVRWNGKVYDRCYVTHQMLMEGGVLEFVMGSKPNKRLFQDKASKPYSLSER